MFKSIVSKLTGVFIIILILSFSMVGIANYYFLGDFITKEKERVLYETSCYISLIVELNSRMGSSSFKGPYDDMLMKNIEQYSKNTGAIIWVVDTSGKIRYPKDYNYSWSGFNILEEMNPDLNTLQLTDKRQYEKVMSLKEGYIKEIGDFYGLFKDTKEKWLTIEKPLVYVDSEGNKTTVGAVYLHAPITDILQGRSEIFRFFIISGSAAALLSSIFVYIITRKLTKGLKKLNNAAKVIAKGEFNERVNISSRDEIGELAQNFNEMASALQNTEEMRREFIANVSHELRTPMTSIKGFVEGILDGTVPKEKHNVYLNIVRDEANRLNRLVNDLLTLSKLQAGELKLVYKKVDINELIRLCIIKMENFFTKKQLFVQAYFEFEEMMVSADPDAIERVIINLLHNAVKFTPPGGKITISTSYHKDKVYVSVQDTGIGIDKEELSHIWERFYKVDKSRSEDRRGTGLGLAIVKNIINEHKQEVWVESEPGKGSKFTFTLNRLNKADIQS